jgi:hypothetical protein
MISFKLLEIQATTAPNTLKWELVSSGENLCLLGAPTQRQPTLPEPHTPRAVLHLLIAVVSARDRVSASAAMQSGRQTPAAAEDLPKAEHFYLCALGREDTR